MGKIRRGQILRLIWVSSAVGAAVSIVATAYFNRGFSPTIVWWGALYGVFIGNAIGFSEAYIGDPLARRFELSARRVIGRLITPPSSTVTTIPRAAAIVPP